jgi:hypothetical protein
MEAGVRLSAALPPESKEIRPLFENTGGSARPAFQYPQPESLPRLDFAGIGNACLKWSERRFGMVLVVSVIGGLLLLAYCVSLVKANRETKKKSIQTLFDTK